MLEVILVLIVVGVLLALANSYLPMSPPIKTILNVVVVLAVVVWVLTAFGFIGSGDMWPAVHRR